MRKPNPFENEMFMEDLAAQEQAMKPLPPAQPTEQELQDFQFPVAPPPPPTEEQILAGAREDRDKMQRYSMMLRSMQDIIGASTGAKVNNAVADQLSSQADIGLKDLAADAVERRAKAQDQRLLAGERRADSGEKRADSADLRAWSQEERASARDPFELSQLQTNTEISSQNLAEQQKLFDPNSSESRLAQAQYLKMFPQADPEMVKNTTAAEIYRVMKPQLEERNRKAQALKDEFALRRLAQADRRLDQNDTKEGRLTNQFGYRKMSKFEDDASKAVQDLRKTDTWKTAEKALVEVPTIKNLVNDAVSKGGQSLAMLGPRIAKGIAGEVGVLTEQDVTRYVQNPALIPGMMDTLSKMKSGKLTNASADNILRLLDIMEKESQSKIQAATAREAQMFAKRQGIPLEDAMYFMDAGYKNTDRVGTKTDEYEIKAPADKEKALKDGASTITKQDDAAIKWAKANPNDPRAKKILELNGMK